jgi:hypothetical protein
VTQPGLQSATLVIRTGSLRCIVMLISAMRCISEDGCSWASAQASTRQSHIESRMWPLCLFGGCSRGWGAPLFTLEPKTPLLFGAPPAGSSSGPLPASRLN